MSCSGEKNTKACGSCSSRLLGDIQRGILNQAYIFPGKEALLSSLNPSFILITAKYGPIKPSSESSRPASCG